MKRFLYINFSPSVAMSGKDLIFDDKKSTMVIFIETKNYLIYMT